MQCPMIPDDTLPAPIAAPTIPSPPPFDDVTDVVVPPPTPSSLDWSGFASEALDEDEEDAA